jgi:DNA-binding NarL/FixJ family response regulator
MIPTHEQLMKDMMSFPNVDIHAAYNCATIALRYIGKIHPLPSKSKSKRQNEVADQLALGHSNKVIATNLGITEATVKVHIQRLMKHYKASNRVQVALAHSGKPYGDNA